MMILIIEDDRLLNNTLKYNLVSEGYKVVSAYNAKEAEKSFLSQTFRLIILDVNLPDGNGFELMRKWRDNISCPIIFLTANDMESDMLKGFELGAEDYITKPFHISVFLKKVGVISRRNQGKSMPRIYNDGNLYINFTERKATFQGKDLELTTGEFNMLYILIRNYNIVLTRKLLLEKLWDSNENYVDENALTMLISRIRTKIDSKEKKYIKTIYGMGYQWIGDSYEE
ncbi:response regulator transcription factor [Clostridium tetani]|uniref:response regulator transcription factor n=1 Tax=Clostridium tetani TaxID=1513 RepID=UPI0005139A88|nr:response regulator transcription factor [Clostridium tetani]KGI39965.1 transcriptional regulator [Clostridium tetani ATCC 9441]